MHEKQKIDSLASILNKIKELLTHQERVVVALDGRSGVGKSTIVQKLANKIQAVVINCDDFYAGPPDGDEKNWLNKTAQEKVNQVFAWQRMKNQAIEPLIAGEMVEYYPFNFQTGIGLSDKKNYLKPAPVIILDGVYTAEKLKDLIDISVSVVFPDKKRRERLIKREGQEFMLDWHAKWDEAEDYYFNRVRSSPGFDFVIEGEIIS